MPGYKFGSYGTGGTGYSSLEGFGLGPSGNVGGTVIAGGYFGGYSNGGFGAGGWGGYGGGGYGGGAGKWLILSL